MPWFVADGVGVSFLCRLWDIENYYKLAKTVGAAKGGINFSINGLCAVSEERFASAADNVKIWSIVAED